MPEASGAPRFLNRIDVVFSILANATVIGALLVAWWSYQAQVDQARRDVAFELVAGLNSGEMLAAQRRFSAAFQSLPLDMLRGEALPRDTMATLIGQLVTTSGDATGLRQDIITLVSYFDDAAVCIETGTCDGDVVRSHVGETAGRYACILIPNTATIREKYLMNGLGDGLKRLVGNESRC